MSDVRRRPHSPPSAGHDVAGMGLPGHLDSQGLDSEVLALTRTSLWYALAGSFESADWQWRQNTGRLQTDGRLKCSEGGPSHWHSAQATGTGTQAVIVAIRACGPGPGTCHASSESVCQARKREP